MNNNLINFINYIKKPISRDEILSEYNKHDIKYDRCILYSDFIQSLMLIVFDTYLGSKIINNDERINHFKWCWDKNVQKFKSEGFYVTSKELYTYFLGFTCDKFYSAEEIDIPLTKVEILKLWLYIFDYNNLKSVYDLDTLIDLYLMFDIS